MHVFREAAAKDLDYSQGLNFMLPSFLLLLPWKMKRKMSTMLACSSPEVYKSAEYFRARKWPWREVKVAGTLAAAGMCSREPDSLSLSAAWHRLCSASFAHGVLATWGSLLWYYRTSLCGHTLLLLCLRCPVWMAFQARCSTFGQPPTR